MHLTNYYYCRRRAPDSDTGAVLSIVTSVKDHITDSGCTKTTAHVHSCLVTLCTVTALIFFNFPFFNTPYISE